MDKYENRTLAITGVVLATFIFSILWSTDNSSSEIPTCIPYDAAFSEPKFTSLGENVYQVNYVAQMWSFEPEEVILPVGSEVDIYLTSKDVVHGFHIPEKNVNLMALYGGINKVTVRFDEPGIYKVLCHEYCGTGHELMQGEIIVGDPDELYEDEEYEDDEEI